MLLYKLSVTVIFCLFIFLISDFRNKKTNPLFTQPWLTIMRIGYPIPPLCFLFFLWNAKSFTIFDLFALLIMVFGTIIVMVSKKELGMRHSWAGYAANNIEDFCISGIYAWIRHPLYLGIIFAYIGMAFVVAPRIDLNLQLALTYLIGSFISIIFIIVSSIKETSFLSDKFGIAFKNYAQQVHAFFPIRKFNGTTVKIIDLLD